MSIFISVRRQAAQDDVAWREVSCQRIVLVLNGLLFDDTGKSMSACRLTFVEAVYSCEH